MKRTTMLASVLIALAFGLTIGTSAADPPPQAKGSPPDKFYWIELNGGPTTLDFLFVPCDGFDTVMSLTLQGFWITHYDNPGKQGWEFYHSAWASRIANADDTSIFVEGIPGQVMNRHWTATPFESDAIETGVQLMITLPGYGVIYRDVGRLRYDIFTGEVQFQAGQWDSLDQDYQALCAALSP